MKVLKYFIVGLVFGIVLTKSEAVSWYRIYGIIGVAFFTGLIGIKIIKKYQLKDIKGETIIIPNKEKGSFRYWIGGLFFGLGWALVGACPGPIFILIGAGFLPVILIFIGALFGTFVYGVIKDRLPH
jgi:uncharacterized membrane protein YedE/YeeE